MPAPIIPATVALPVIKEMINAASQYLACKEHERTERERISAQLEAKLTIINKQFDTYSQVLAEHHDYAMKSYKVAEDLINDPFVRSNIELMKCAMTFFANVHSKNSDNLTSMFANMSFK